MLPKPSSPMSIDRGSLLALVLRFLGGKLLLEFVDSRNIVRWNEIERDLPGGMRSLLQLKRHFGDHSGLPFTILPQRLVLFPGRQQLRRLHAVMLCLTLTARFDHPIAGFDVLVVTTDRFTSDFPG